MKFDLLMCFVALIRVPTGTALRKTLLPRCLGDSACGYVQESAHGSGRVEICKCGGSRHCDLTMEDGMQSFLTINGIKEQYKFCTPSGKTVAKCSSALEASYVSYEYFDSTGRKVAQKDDLICECPKFAAYTELSATQWAKGDITAKVTSYSCTKIPFCQAGSTFEEITEFSPLNRVTDPRCVPSDQRRCDRRATSISTLAQGKLYTVTCQEEEEEEEEGSRGHPAP